MDVLQQSVKKAAIERVRESQFLVRAFRRNLVALTDTDQPGLVFVAEADRGGYPRVSGRWWVVTAEAVRRVASSTTRTSGSGASVLVGALRIHLM